MFTTEEAHENISDEQRDQLVKEATEKGQFVITSGNSIKTAFPTLDEDEISSYLAMGMTILNKTGDYAQVARFLIEKITPLGPGKAMEIFIAMSTYGIGRSLDLYNAEKIISSIMRESGGPIN